MAWPSRSAFELCGQLISPVSGYGDGGKLTVKCEAITRSALISNLKGMENQNQRWLEAAFISFDEARETGDLVMCKAIIADTQEAGFLDAGRIMTELLRNTPVERFSKPSPYQNEE